MTTLRRSALFTPADDAEMLRKAISVDADAFIFDLEDSVPPSSKGAARDNVRRIIPDLETDREIGVRVNAISTDHFESDVETAIDAGADALLLPMVTGGEDVNSAWDAMTDIVDSPPPLRIAIETPRGMHAGVDIAEASRKTGVISLEFGFADYSKAIGAPGTPDPLRERLEQMTAEFASIGEIDPIASVHLDIDDEKGLRNVAKRARETGFVGMTAIHPRQVSIINEVFTPSDEEIDQARKLVEAFDNSPKDSLLVDGIFLDTATVDRYRRLLERAPNRD